MFLFMLNCFEGASDPDLVMAARAGDADRVLALLGREDVDVDMAASSNGQTALSAAAEVTEV